MSHKDSWTDDDLDTFVRESLMRREASEGPTSVHVEQVREQLLARCAPLVQVRRSRRYLLRGLLAAGLAAGLLMAILLVRQPTAGAWEELRAALGNVAWVHVQMTGPDGRKVESWLSSRRSVAAARVEKWVVYDDFRQGIRYEYRPDEKKLYRLALGDSLTGSFRDAVDVLAQIIRNDEELSVGTGGPEIVQQSKRTVYEGSAESVEYTVTTRLAGGRKVTTILRVDPQTHLPQSATIRQSEGSELLCRFDYPEFGPEDVYALGVAKNAIVVDRVPSADLQRVATGVLNGRRQFDDYYCLLVHSSANQHWSQASRMYRTWRKGDCWRIEQSFTDPEDDEALARQPLPPDDVDRKAYWFQRAKETRFYPVLVCDGQHIWRFKQEFDQPTEKRFTFKTTGAERDPVDFDQSFVMLPLFTPAPELEGHSAPLGGTSAKVVERLNPHPDQGPAGTVLVEREYIGRRGQPQKQDLDRYWVDPVNGYLVMRHEMVDLDHDPPQIIQSREIADWKRSPRGFFYPVELKWDESGIAHYYLDFVTPDAAMFSPKATESIKQRVATR